MHKCSMPIDDQSPAHFVYYGYWFEETPMLMEKSYFIWQFLQGLMILIELFPNQLLPRHIRPRY
jgi:hypothetical protein